MHASMLNPNRASTFNTSDSCDLSRSQALCGVLNSDVTLQEWISLWEVLYHK